MSKRKLSKRQKDRIHAIQEKRRYRAMQQNTADQNEIHSSTLGPELRGTVITNFGTQVDIETTNSQNNVVRCHIPANVDPLVTGDKVIWRSADPFGVVVASEKRRSELLRPDIYGNLRPVAANIDIIAIVFSAQPAAFSAGARPGLDRDGFFNVDGFFE